ncbi:MAG: hypothetical protein ACUVRE_06465 [Thermoanaerobaculaceae bacterium]
MSLAGACAPPAVPARLAGLPRTKLIGGARAVHLMSTIHGGRFRPPRAVVAEYGSGKLLLYVATFHSPEEARQAVEKMLKTLGANREFSPPRALEPGVMRWLTVGPGGHHLFWRSARQVFWLAGEPEAVFSALEGLPSPPKGLEV